MEPNHREFAAVRSISVPIGLTLNLDPLATRQRFCNGRRRWIRWLRVSGSVMADAVGIRRLPPAVL